MFQEGGSGQQGHIADIFSDREAVADLRSHLWESDGGCISQIAGEEDRVEGGTEVAGIDSSSEKFVGGMGTDT